MSQETVSEGGSLGELDGVNAPEQNENTPSARGDNPHVHDGIFYRKETPQICLKMILQLHIKWRCI